MKKLMIMVGFAIFNCQYVQPISIDSDTLSAIGKNGVFFVINESINRTMHYENKDAQVKDIVLAKMIIGSLLYISGELAMQNFPISNHAQSVSNMGSLLAMQGFFDSFNNRSMRSLAQASSIFFINDIVTPLTADTLQQRGYEKLTAALYVQATNTVASSIILNSPLSQDENIAVVASAVRRKAVFSVAIGTLEDLKNSIINEEA